MKSRVRFSRFFVSRKMKFVSSELLPTPPPRSFEQLLQDARGGSKTALGELFERLRPYLSSLARKKLPDQLRGKFGVSDLVQNTFECAEKHFAGFRGNCSAEWNGWLRRILLRKLRREVIHFTQPPRDIKREIPQAKAGKENGGQHLPTNDPTPGTDAAKRELCEKVRRALTLLPENYRQVIVWHQYEGKTFDEIGNRLNRSGEAARKLWARAVERLNEIVGPIDAPRRS